MTKILFKRKKAWGLSAWCRVLSLTLAFAVSPLAAGPQHSEAVSPATAHLATGLSLLRSGNASAALSEFQEACRLDPNSAQALVLVGVAQNQLGNVQQAMTALRHALQLDPASEAAHYNLAMSLAQLKQTDDAIHELRSVLKLNPQSSLAHYNLGVLLEDRGDYQGAIQDLLAVKKAQPDDAAALFHLVRAYYGAGNSTQAIRVAQEAASYDSKGELAVRLAQLMIRHNDFEQAVQLLAPIRARVQVSPALDMTLARAYIGAGELRKAIGLLEVHERDDPSWQSAYLLGLAYVSDKRPEPAIAAFRNSLRRNPNQAEGHFRLGKLLLGATNESDQQAGLEELHQAIALDSHTSEYYEVLGRWLLQREKLKEAIEVLDQGIKAGTPSAELEALMGLAQAALHGGASAKPFAEKALQQDSRMALAHYLVGFCYFNAGDYAQAVEYYKQATKLDPRDDLFYYNTALALQRLNRVSEALPYAQRSTEINPGRSLNHYLLGKLYTKLNRNDEAVPELETSIRLNPRLDNSYYLLSLIYERSGNTIKAQGMRDKLAQLKHTREGEAIIESPESAVHEMILPSRLLQNHDLR